MYNIVFALLIFSTLTYSVKCASILCVFSFPAVSHQAFFRPIWKALALRGHDVVVITPNPLRDPSLKTLKEVDVSSSYEILKRKPVDVVMNTTSLLSQYNNIINLSFEVLEYQLTQPNVRKVLIDENIKFDVILVESFYPMLYVLGQRYNAPVIGITSLPTLLTNSLAVGNPVHPVLNPDCLLGFKRRLSFFERVYSTFHTLLIAYNSYYRILPKAQEIAERVFGAVPDLYEAERNVTLMITASNQLIYPVRALLPNFIEVSFVHLQPVRELPQDLKQILDGASEGLIYFSLGSNVKSVNIPDRLKQVIISALSELPYKVLWKWEADHMPGKPDNVIIRKWLPQQDLLAHPNVKAFVTQGGLQSAEEGIARGVPMIGLPFFGDQPMNVVKLAEAGVAIHLDKDTVTKDELKSAIIEVVQNEKYRKRVLEIRDLLYDQPMKSIDKAVWWIEYVIRHKGARHLRSPSLDLPWYQYFLLDVIGATLAVIILVLFVLCKISCLIIRSVFSKKKVKTS